jgi:hypothetical protein
MIDEEQRIRNQALEDAAKVVLFRYSTVITQAEREDFADAIRGLKRPWSIEGMMIEHLRRKGYKVEEERP